MSRIHHLESHNLIFIKFFEFQIRQESIETVNKILEEANKRIQPTGTGNDAAVDGGVSIDCHSWFLICLIPIFLGTFFRGAIWGS